MSFCKYKDVLGKPREGTHADRILGLAKVDVYATLILIVLISFMLGTGLLKTAAVTIMVAELLHVLFCVDTAFLNAIGIRFAPMSTDVSVEESHQVV